MVSRLVTFGSPGPEGPPGTVTLPEGRGILGHSEGSFFSIPVLITLGNTQHRPVLRIQSNGSIAFESVPDLPLPGSEGQILQSNGSDWVSAAVNVSLPEPGAEGGILQSNGTSWVRADPTGSELPVASQAGRALVTKLNASNIPTWYEDLLDLTGGDLVGVHNAAYVVRLSGSPTGGGIVIIGGVSGDLPTTNWLKFADTGHYDGYSIPASQGTGNNRGRTQDKIKRTINAGSQSASLIATTIDLPATQYGCTIKYVINVSVVVIGGVVKTQTLQGERQVYGATKTLRTIGTDANDDPDTIGVSISMSVNTSGNIDISANGVPANGVVDCHVMRLGGGA